jgi:hypothetical protein
MTTTTHEVLFIVQEMDDCELIYQTMGENGPYAIITWTSRAGSACISASAES